jgi:Tol biopolymer transport system component
VYRARDTRLDREVAVKVLPEHLSASSEARQRFEREARAASSLNHPNICTIHDIGTHEGTDYLVMELLEGETLADRLERGPLPLDDLIEVAVPLADALDRAHRSGLVHRDLKPGNVMLAQGGVKLLDFGLAKVIAAAPEVSSLTALPTAASPLTAQGTIVGTFQYMAPEQLEGKEADARTDVFAFGCILHEMAAGKRAFDGKTQAGVMAAILEREPEPLSEARPGIPAALERLVRTCLEKDPQERRQTMHDVLLELRWIAEGGGAEEGAGATIRPVGRLGTSLGWVLAAMFLTVAGFLFVRSLGTADGPRETVRLSIALPQELRISAEPMEIAVSPDGKTVAFVASDSSGTSYLWLRPFASRQPARVPNTEGVSLPFWSPDGGHVGFFTPGKLNRVAASGGRSPQVICNATSGRGGSWNEDGIIVFAPYSSGPIFSVPAGGGEPTQVTELDASIGETAQRFPQFLPDGRHFIYASLAEGDGVETRLASLDGGPPAATVSADGAAVYAEGYLLFQRAGELLAVRFDPARREVAGEPFALADKPGGLRGYAGSRPMAISSSGVIVYPEGLSATELRWVDRRGNLLEILSLPPDFYQSPDISPDGSRVAIVRPSPENGTDVWMIDLDRSVATRLTFSPQENNMPVWSPDGRNLLFGSSRDGSRNIYVKGGAGAGATQLLLRMEGPFATPMDWSPDGAAILIRDLSPATMNDVYVYYPESETLEPLLISRFEERGAAISPDGKWLAYRSDESGQEEIYIQPFPGLGTKHRISTDGSDSPLPNGAEPPLWSRDGTELIYLSSDRRTLMAVPIRHEPSFRAGHPERLFEMPEGTLSYTSIDNERFLLGVAQGGTWNLAVVTNWVAELEGR